MGIIAVEDYEKESPRISGIKLLNQVKKNISREWGKTVNAKVVTDDSFRDYLRKGKLSEKDKSLVIEEAEKFLTISKTGLLAARRAFLVPGLENPPGPRFLGIKSAQEMVEAIEEIFGFAKKHGYYQKKGSLIEVFFYPFVDPPQLDYPLKKGIVLPRGGYAVPSDEQAKSVKILAVFGNNEGVQSLKGVDEYLVDMDELLIKQKIIVQKEYGLCTTVRDQNDKVKLPLEFQFAQVLNDGEILEVAAVVRECSRLKGKPQRVEFSSDGKELFFSEVAEYEIEKVDWQEKVIEGEILVVDGPEQISEIKRDSSDQIIYITKKVVENRDFDTLNTVAAIRENLSILYPGTTVTAHAMRVLIDAGHRAFVVGNRIFKNGERVRITVQRNKILVERILRENEGKIISLEEAGNYEVEVVGGKAKRLGELISLGFKVPWGVVIPSGLMGEEDFLNRGEFTGLVASLDGKKSFAVRSSADIEDSGRNAFAGQFLTETCVLKDKVELAVRKVWRSAEKGSLKLLLEELSISKVKMAVVIQEMIRPSFSGVVFGANIETKDRSQVVIEITAGYAEGVVDGIAKVRRIIFEKMTGKTMSDSGGVKISEEWGKAVFEMYSRIEEDFGVPQDVEWTIDRDGNLFVLQARDLMF